MTKLAILLSLALAIPAFADLPQIALVTPSSGPVTGGTTITIHGSGFDTSCSADLLICGAPTVRIGSLPPASFRVIDPQTIEAVTQVALPGPADVTVTFPRGTTRAAGAFTYTGNVSDAFDTILLPLFTPPASGSFGSRFETFFSLWNTSGPDVPVLLSTGSGLLLKARAGSPAPDLAFDGNPGRLLYLPKGSFERLAAALRVTDTSRTAESFGTRIPVVDESDFRTDFQALLDLPMNKTSRSSVRIYSLDPGTSVHVRVVSNDSTMVYQDLDVTLSDPDMFHPGYALLASNFGVKEDTIRVEVTPNTPGKRVWALASVTNNETQQITIASPH